MSARLPRSAVAALLLLVLAAAVGARALTARAAAPALQIRIHFVGAPPSQTHRGFVADSNARIVGNVTEGGKGAEGVIVRELYAINGRGATIGPLITSGPNGRFELSVPVQGFEDVSFTSGGLSSNVLRVLPTVAVSLHLSRHRVHPGGTVIFSGATRPAIPANLTVVIQVKSLGHYRAFKVLRTRSNGTFSGKYPLTQGPVSYTIRVEIPGQYGLFFAKSFSRSSHLHVT